MPKLIFKDYLPTPTRNRRAATKKELFQAIEEEIPTGPEIHSSGETYQGTHGYLPTNPAMRASLILYGAGVRKGVQIPFVRMVDIAPSIASLLKLDLPNTEGNPLKTLLLAK